MASFQVLEDEAGLQWRWSFHWCQAFDANGKQVLDLAPLLTVNQSEQVLIYSLFLDRAGRLWVGTNNGVFVVSLRKNPFQTFFHQAGGVSSFRGMAQDSRRTVFLNSYTKSDIPFHLPEDRPISSKFPLSTIGLAPGK